MVEFAIILPIFVALVAGILGFGLVFFTQLELSSAAQEGARRLYLGASASGAETAVRAAAAVPDGELTVTINTTCETSPSGTEVLVTATRPMNVEWVLGSSAIDVTGQGVIRCQ